MNSVQARLLRLEGRVFPDSRDAIKMGVATLDQYADAMRADIADIRSHVLAVAATLAACRRAGLELCSWTAAVAYAPDEELPSEIVSILKYWELQAQMDRKYRAGCQSLYGMSTAEVAAMRRDHACDLLSLGWPERLDIREQAWHRDGHGPFRLSAEVDRLSASIGLPVDEIGRFFSGGEVQTVPLASGDCWSPTTEVDGQQVLIDALQDRIVDSSDGQGLVTFASLAEVIDEWCQDSGSGTSD